MFIIRKILLSLMLLVAVLVTLVLWPYQGTIRQVATTQKVVALTFDDGPNPPHTQALLEVLEAHDVRATFFAKGRNVEAFPALLRAIAEQGHEIGNHSVYHGPMSALGTVAMRQEVAQESRAASVAATDLILQTLTAQGYRFITVGELLDLRGS